MLRWLDRPKAPWKDFAVSEYYAHNTASGYTMLRSGEWKYVYHNVIDPQHPAQRELYNLTHAPQEFTSLAEVPAHKTHVDALHQRMLAEVGANPDEIEKRSREELSRGYTRPDPKPPER